MKKQKVVYTSEGQKIVYEEKGELQENYHMVIQKEKNGNLRVIRVYEGEK